MSNQSFKSFNALAAYLRAEDVRKAENLRKSAALRKSNVRKSGTGPAVAR